MTFRGLDLNLLVVLDALLTEKSITRAGERIHLSQSATSNALSRLREYFADELLSPCGHRMMLTPRGNALIEPVRNLLMRTEAILRTDLDFCAETSKRTFRVMMSDYAASVVLCLALPELKRRAPQIGVDVWPLVDDSAKCLERGDVDFLIGPAQITSPEHPREELCTDAYVCMAWSGNQDVGNALNADQYLSMRHAVVRLGPNRRQTQDEESLVTLGHNRTADVTVSSFLLLPQTIVGTRLLATVHGRLARAAVRSLPLRILPLPIEIPPLVIMLQWHEDHGFEPGNGWFRKTLRELVEKSSGQAGPAASYTIGDHWRNGRH